MNGFYYLKQMTDQQLLNHLRTQAFLKIVPRPVHQPETSRVIQEDPDDSDSIEVLKLKLKIAEIKLKEARAKIRSQKVRTEYIQPEIVRPKSTENPMDWIDWAQFAVEESDNEESDSLGFIQVR